MSNGGTLGMVYVIPQQTHDGTLSFAEGIDIVREAFKEYGENPHYNETRHRIHTESGVRTSIHGGAVPSVGGTGLLTHTSTPESTEDCQERGNRAHSVYVVNDTEDGDLLAVLLGELGSAELRPQGSNAFRTACTSAVGLQDLKPENATALGIFGSGSQARNHLVAFNRVLDHLTSVTVYSPTKEHRESFAAEMTAHVDVDIQAVSTPGEVVSGSDVVLCATSASSPVFDGDRLEPGQTVISIVGSNVQLVESGYAPSRRREVDDTTVACADTVVANSVEQARIAEQGDLYLPVREGILKWDDVVPLRDIVTGTTTGRRSDDEIVLYKNNTGEGIADVALATRIYERIVEQDRAIDLPVYDPR